MDSTEQDGRPFYGKTYSLYGDTPGTGDYYDLIKDLTNLFLQRCPDEKRLLSQLRHAGNSLAWLKKLSGRDVDLNLILFMKKTLKGSLSKYTKNVKQHLRTIPLSQRFDSIIKTRESQYHLYMIEIELHNRIYKELFRKSEYKFALIAHCLRDFRPECRAEPGDIESMCKGCTKDCFVNLGSRIMKKYNIHPYISVTMELEDLFKGLKKKYNSIGALGIACVPELANGMRLCVKHDIPPVGIPLDANRCSRWMKECKESSFNLDELEKLVK